MGVPLFDCQIDANGRARVDRVLQSGQLGAGAEVTALEAAFAEHLDCAARGQEVVALANMTQGLEFALHLAGVKPGDDVLTLSFNCLSSNAAIHTVGARPVWVDLDPETAAMDASHARAQLTPATRALIVYHVAGYPADMTALRALCDEAGIALIEDANAAFGTTLADGTPVGALGDFAVFSLYANRQINGAEGGILVCPTAEAADHARRLRRFGIDQTTFRDPNGDISAASDIPEIGVAATLGNVNAALGLASLQTLADRRARALEAHDAFTEAFAAMPHVTPVAPAQGARPFNWVFLLLADDQAGLLANLRAAGIGCGKLHQPNHIYTGFGAQTPPLPGTDRFAQSMVAIPGGWWISTAQRADIIAAVKSGT